MQGYDDMPNDGNGDWMFPALIFGVGFLAGMVAAKLLAVL